MKHKNKSFSSPTQASANGITSPTINIVDFQASHVLGCTGLGGS